MIGPTQIKRIKTAERETLNQNQASSQGCRVWQI